MVTHQSIYGEPIYDQNLGLQICVSELDINNYTYPRPTGPFSSPVYLNLLAACSVLTANFTGCIPIHRVKIQTHMVVNSSHNKQHTNTLLVYQRDSIEITMRLQRYSKEIPMRFQRVFNEIAKKSISIYATALKYLCHFCKTNQRWCVKS